MPNLALPHARRTTLRALFFSFVLAGVVVARQATIEINPPRAVADSFDAIPVEVLVFLGGELLGALPEDLGTRVIGGAGRVQSRWLFDPLTNSWRFHYEVFPEQVGLMEVEFYHRDLDSLGAIGRFQVQVLLNENSAPPRLYLLEPDGSLTRLDPGEPLHFLPETEHTFLLAVDDGDIDRLSYSIPGTSDFSLEVVQPGELFVRAIPEPATPGVTRVLRIRDQSGRRPDLSLPLVLHDPCLICGAPHHEDTHPSQQAPVDVIPSGEALAPVETSLQNVADVAVFASLNMIEPAPTYLQTSERTVIFRGHATERLTTLDAVAEYPGGTRRHFPALTVGHGETVHFAHTFRLKPGHNRLFFIMKDTDGLERNVEFTLFRE